MIDNRPVPATTIPSLDELVGLWRRSSIAWPDGRVDTATAVAWLQGPRFYADLRQPADRPAFAGIDGPRQLRPEHVTWLARQEGFAGTLDARGGDFEWHRQIDFQPPAAHPDVGRLRVEGELLFEEGCAVAYIEVWRRGDTAAVQPAFALAMRDCDSDAAGLILRVGDTFMYARDRSIMLPPHRSLADCVLAATNLREAQDLLDCEISLGTIAGPCWTIENSSLPFREGRDLRPQFSAIDDGLIKSADVTPDGVALTRRWTVIEAQGATGELARPSAAVASDSGGDPSAGLRSWHKS